MRGWTTKRDVFQQIVDLQKAPYKNVTALQARACLDHFAMQRLVAKTETLRGLEPWEREVLAMNQQV